MLYRQEKHCTRTNLFIIFIVFIFSLFLFLIFLFLLLLAFFNLSEFLLCQLPFWPHQALLCSYVEISFPYSSFSLAASLPSAACPCSHVTTQLSLLLAASAAKRLSFDVWTTFREKKKTERGFGYIRILELLFFFCFMRDVSFQFHSRLSAFAESENVPLSLADMVSQLSEHFLGNQGAD